MKILEAAATTISVIILLIIGAGVTVFLYAMGGIIGLLGTFFITGLVSYILIRLVLMEICD